MIPEGLDVKFTRQETGKTRHLGVFSRQNRVFSRHKQMCSPSGYPKGTTGDDLFATGREEDPGQGMGKITRPNYDGFYPVSVE